MRSSLLVAVSAVLAACQMSTPEPAKAPPPAAAAPAPAPAAAPAPVAAAPAPAAPAMPKNSIAAVQASLAGKGITAKEMREMKDKLGGRAECAAQERKMMVMGNENKFYAVGNYGDAAKAQACLTALGAWYGPKWATMSKYYVQKGAFIFEMGEDMPDPDRKNAQDAFVAAVE